MATKWNLCEILVCHVIYKNYCASRNIKNVTTLRCNIRERRAGNLTLLTTVPNAISNVKLMLLWIRMD